MIERRRSGFALAAFVVLALAIPGNTLILLAQPRPAPAGEVMVHLLSTSPEGDPQRVRLEFPPDGEGHTLPGSIEVDLSPEELDALRSAVRVLHRSTDQDGLERTIFRLAGDLPRACGDPVSAAGPFEAIGTGSRLVLRDLGRDVAVTFRVVGEHPELRPRIFGPFLQLFLCLRAHLAFQEQCFDSCKEDCGDAGVQSVRSSDFCGRRGSCECTCRSAGGGPGGSSDGDGEAGDPEDETGRGP